MPELNPICVTFIVFSKCVKPFLRSFFSCAQYQYIVVFHIIAETINGNLKDRFRIEIIFKHCQETHGHEVFLTTLFKYLTLFEYRHSNHKNPYFLTSWPFIKAVSTFFFRRQIPSRFSTIDLLANLSTTFQKSLSLYPVNSRKSFNIILSSL